MIVTRRMMLVLAGLVLLVSFFLILASDTPGYTDAYYYYNAGERLATGDGLTDAYLWVYVNAPDKLPTASNRYWMPLASLLVALPMALFGSGFHAAQWAFVPCLVGLALLGMWLGGKVGGTRRHAWIAGISVLAGGFYLPFWLTSDTFAIFGLAGAGVLIALGLGKERDDFRWYGLAGVCAALAHLTRADGLLFLLVGLIVTLLPKNKPHPLPPLHAQGGRTFGSTEGSEAAPAQGAGEQSPLSGTERGFRGEVKIWSIGILLSAYLLVILPWFVRSMAIMGMPLPAGGIGTAFLRGYNEIFSYPATWRLGDFLDWGAGNIIKSRLDGLLIAFETWLAVEGLIILAPFALWALWKRRREAFFAPLIWYALGLHLAMSVVFTYPGSRGGLFHSSAALFPFWIALGLVGVDDGIGRLARWRRWKVEEARIVFGVSTLLLPIALGFFAWNIQTRNRDAEPDYQLYAGELPAEARIMVNDPAAWYYHTGYLGVTLPDEALETAYEIAQRYCITHLIIDQNVTAAFEPLIRGETPPPFLTEIRHFDGTDPEDWSDDVRVYAFDVLCTP